MNLQINTNLLETNLLNILILISFLLYGYKVSYGPTLEARKKIIVTNIQKDHSRSLQGLYNHILTEENIAISFSYLQCCKSLRCIDKIKSIKNKYVHLKRNLRGIYLFGKKMSIYLEIKMFIFSKKHVLTVLANQILEEFF